MNSGSNLDWIYVISALYCVALSSIFLLLFIIDSGDPEKKFIYLASFIGGGCFVFHTLFLDGLIWTIFFHKKL
jgi:hypothetical protein